MTAGQDNGRWRACAQRLYGINTDDRSLSVNPHGLVQNVGGGAFVECMVWVPEKEMEHGETPKTQEAEASEGREAGSVAQ